MRNSAFGICENKGADQLRGNSIKSLNPSKALWLGELHPRVLKELATELGLAHISPLFK